jgi:hypothetical protein
VGSLLGRTLVIFMKRKNVRTQPHFRSFILIAGLD